MRWIARGVTICHIRLSRGPDLIGRTAIVAQRPQLAAARLGTCLPSQRRPRPPLPRAASRVNATRPGSPISTVRADSRGADSLQLPRNDRSANVPLIDDL